MKEIARWIQLFALVLVGAAAIPLIANQWAEWNTRRTRAERATHHGAVGRVALEGGDPDLASRAYAAALELDPGRAEWHDGLLQARIQQVLALTGSLTTSDALQLQDELGAALAATRRPSAQLLVAYGKLLLARGDNLAARKKFEQAIEADGSFAPAHLNLGVAFFRSGELAPASAALEKALELEEGMPLALFTLGQVRAAQERWEEAVSNLERAAERLEDPAVHLALGKGLIQIQRWPDAEKALERALALSPDLAAAHAPLGRVYLATGKQALAQRQLELAWQRTGDRESYARLGRLYQRASKWDAALRIFNELAQYDPEDPEPHYRIAMIAEERGDLEIAQKALEWAIERAEKKPEHEKLLLNARGRLEALRMRNAKEGEGR